MGPDARHHDGVPERTPRGTTADTGTTAPDAPTAAPDRRGDLTAADTHSAAAVELLTVQQRRDLYRYITADNADEYRAIMTLFSSHLFLDLSAAELHARLADTGVDLDPDDVEQRCKQLEKWGNLVRSVRTDQVATIAELAKSRFRYQISKLGGRVTREVEEVLRTSEGVRDVARELLAATVLTLERITTTMAQVPAGGRLAPADVDRLAQDVTTVFNNQRLFRDTATDFYAYIQSRISRYDLGGPEYLDFKQMLLTQVDILTADVALHAPRAAALLEGLTPTVPAILAALDAQPHATAPRAKSASATSASPASGQPIEPAGERLPGRTVEDWDGLRSWYTGERGQSGHAQLRGAAGQALTQLIANAKRILTASGTGMSRRLDLLSLAGWFAGADHDTAHRLYDAAFGAYPARHLGHGPEEDDGRAGATTSWWEADPVDIAVSLRERGDRTARGRTSKVPDSAMEREALLSEAHEQEERRRAVGAELAAAGALHGARISPQARDLLLDLLSGLLAATSPALTEDPRRAPADGPDRAAGAEGAGGSEAGGELRHVDRELGLVLSAAAGPGHRTVVHANDGDLTVHDLTLRTDPLTDALADLLDGYPDDDADQRPWPAAPNSGTRDDAAPARAAGGRR